jgi:Mg/Co/Ni transporter MgtE
MKSLSLFLVASVLGGAGGALGSMVGHSFGKGGIWVGGILGGILASILGARIALWRGWISRAQLWPTTVGTVIGFFLACIVVVNTLSSPVGPLLTTLIIGAGALVGARVSS